MFNGLFHFGIWWSSGRPVSSLTLNSRYEEAMVRMGRSHFDSSWYQYLVQSIGGHPLLLDDGCASIYSLCFATFTKEACLRATACCWSSTTNQLQAFEWLVKAFNVTVYQRLLINFLSVCRVYFLIFSTSFLISEMISGKLINVRTSKLHHPGLFPVSKAAMTSREPMSALIT
jgi:hypothetical protein